MSIVVNPTTIVRSSQGMNRSLELMCELLKGKGLLRTLENLACQSHPLSGKIIDLGAKDGASSYYRFFPTVGAVQFTFVDRYPKDARVVAVDLEAPLPFDDATFKIALLMNVLYLIYNAPVCARECFRILAPGGELIGAVPYIYKSIPEPLEYFRFSGSALERLYREAGFSNVTVTTLGEGPLSTAAALVTSVIPWPRLCAPLVILALLLDRLVRVFAGSRAQRYRTIAPIGFFFCASK